MSTSYYKILGLDRQPCHGGAGQWPEPGEWRVETGPLRLRRRGTLHLCRLQDLPIWIATGAEVWAAEPNGDVVVGDDKVGTLRARLTRRLGVLTPALLVTWARECADHVAYLRDVRADDDDARAHAAARSAEYAADAAAEAAANYYAGLAGRDGTIRVDYAVRSVASAAADTAYYAAAAADGRAAEVAERTWQGERLLALLERGD